MMKNVSFTANLIKRTQIQKRDENGDYHSAKASIVELDKNYEKDVKSLKKAAFLWNEQGAKYSTNIYHEAVKGYEYDDVDEEHYFALTTQESGFDDLDSEKILGLMLFSRERFSDDEITWLQVRPNTNSKQTWKREYKEVGKAMIDVLKDMNLKKTIHVMSSPEAVEFYKKQGFEPMPEEVGGSLYLKG